MKKQRVKKFRLVLFVMVSVFFVSATAMKALGADAVSFYKGKVIQLVVPYTPGGGYDAYARTIAPLIEKKSGATIIVRNMPGGETYVAQNNVYHGKPNGLTILILDGMVATLNQLSKDPKTKGIDLMKYEWLARLSYEQGAIVLSKKSPYRTIDDLKKAEKVIKFAGTKGSSVSIIGCTFLEIAGLRGEVIQGFGGSSGPALAAMRGEIDGFGNSASSALNFAKQEELFVFCVVSNKRSSLMPDIATIGELMTLTPQHLKWMDRLETILGAGRLLVTTPGVPKERVQFLQTILKEILTDKEFLKESQRLKRPIDFLEGDDAKRNVSNLLTIPESEAKEINHVLLEKYLVN